MPGLSPTLTKGVTEERNPNGIKQNSPVLQGGESDTKRKTQGWKGVKAQMVFEGLAVKIYKILEWNADNADVADLRGKDFSYWEP